MAYQNTWNLGKMYEKNGNISKAWDLYDEAAFLAGKELGEIPVKLNEDIDRVLELRIAEELSE